MHEGPFTEGSNCFGASEEASPKGGGSTGRGWCCVCNGLRLVRERKAKLHKKTLEDFHVLTFCLDAYLKKTAKPLN